jgi:hypothetical protein
MCLDIIHPLYVVPLRGLGAEFPSECQRHDGMFSITCSKIAVRLKAKKADESSLKLNTSASEPTFAIKAIKGSSAADLGLRDFYSVYVLAYCEGYVNGGQRNVTSCSDRSAIFAFNPSNVLESELNPGFNMSDIDWPDTITDDFSVMESTTKAMSVLYVIGAGATGLTLLMQILLTQAGGRPSMIAHLFFTVVRPHSFIAATLRIHDIPLTCF